MVASEFGKLMMQDGPTVGEEYQIENAVTLIGRDQSADIYIDHVVVSRKHARINFQGEQYYLEDLKSSNGTFINGTAVSEPALLHEGDQISLGHAVVLVFNAPQHVQPATEIAAMTQLDTGKTVFENQPLEAPQGPRRELVVSVSGQAPKTYLLTKARYTLGRSNDNDIVIPTPIISRRHALLELGSEGYRLEVTPEASNRLLFRQKPLLAAHQLYDGDEIRVDSSMTEMQVSLRYNAPGDMRKLTLEQLASYTAPPQIAQASDQTLLDAGIGEQILSVPPQLIVTVAGNLPQTHTLTADKITIGRAEDNQIIIPSQIVSRHHARLERVPGGYQLIILADVSNTLVCQGKPVVERCRLHHADILRIDSDIPGMMVTMTYLSPGETVAESQLQQIQFEQKEKLTFGRDLANDVQLNAPTVSRFHAEVERVGHRYRLSDLNSANGTFVNDERVEREAWLNPQDAIRIGPYRFVLGENHFTRFDESSGLRVEALGLNKFVRKNVNILANISLVFQPREFVVVVGQSGGGKSTLVDAVAGYRPATQGRVSVNGIDVYKNFDAIRNEIGYVPQRDIIHMELSVYQALEYAAKLRMPRDTSKAERHNRIMEVLEDLDLVHRKDMQISRLSGGQIKRVSIGVELLTRPGLFFLDEPTSGLDPGTETAFMHLMRRLADQGRTIILVTHATKNVMLADKVVFLARGGYLAWFGPPDEALKFFDQYRSERERRSRPMEFDQIYAILDDPSKGSAQDWAKRYQEHVAHRQYIEEPLRSHQSELPLSGAIQAAQKAAPRKKRKGAQISSLRQFFILSARNVKILTRDRSSLILMMVAAPLVAMLDFVIAPLMGSAPFDYQNGDAANGAITLFLLTIYSLLVAGLSQMREFVKENDIYRRERMVNLRIFPYVSSKVWVALLLAFYHGAAYTIVHHLAFDMPGGTLEFGLFYITMVIASMAGMMCGLLASAMAPAASSAPMIMILLLVPQIVLSGALAPVPTTISAIAPTRWAFEGLIGITGIGSDVAADPCWKLDEGLRDSMSLDDKQANGCRCMGLALFEPGKCNFPGIGQYYEPELDLPEPMEPPVLAEKPAEPIIPPAPDPPADQFDQVAVAQYLNALQSYQDEVTRIQEDYKNQMQLYESQADVYKEGMADYQQEYTKWMAGREQATKGAEGLIESVTEEFGWAFVDKQNTGKFWSWITTSWLAQGTIMAVFFVIILVLIRRKDVK